MKRKKVKNTKSLNLLKKPFSLNQLKRLSKNGEKYVTAVVSISVNNMFGGYDCFLDSLSQSVIGDDLLSDISYEVVGGKGQSIYIQVTGDFSYSLECSNS